MSKFLFLDMETTGLDPEKCSVLELAMIVTDGELKELDEWSVVFSHDYDKIWSEMDDWCRKTHSASGLLGEVNQSSVIVAGIQNAVLKFIDKHFSPDEKPVMVGNTSGFDRSFAKVHMPKLFERCHYRTIDVSGIWEWIYRITGIPRRGLPVAHRAIDDARQSIEFLREATDLLLKNPTVEKFRSTV